MLSAEELRFSTRTAGSLPDWISNPERPLRIWSLAEAKAVKLRSGSENILVRVREQSSLFVGEISGFEPSGGAEFRGLRIGDLIVFRQSHIFEASA